MTKSKTAKPTRPLPSSALRKLRALGHALSPVVAIGKDGLTDAIARATDAALTAHELIKVKIQREAPVDRREAAEELAKRTGAALAQVVGRTLLLYRRHPKKPKIDLSEKRVSAKKPVKSAPEEAPVEADASEDDGDFGDDAEDPDGDDAGED